MQWKNGLDEPEDSDPAAKKGGVFRYFVSSFPPTLRPFGPASNSGMRGELYDDVQLGLVALNRLNSSVVPATAKEWAHGPNKRTWYFMLHEDAAYSDDVCFCNTYLAPLKEIFQLLKISSNSGT